MPLLLNYNSLGLDVSRRAGQLQELLLHFFKFLCLLDGRRRSGRRQRIIDKEDRRLFSRFGREEDRDILVLVEALDPSRKANGQAES